MLKLLSSLTLISLNAYGGSCCGGGASAVSIITGDANTVFRSMYSNRTILADANDDSNITNRPNSQLESIETVTTSIGHRINSRWQLGASIPVVTKSREINKDWESETGLGDISVNSGYEFYPEFTRHQFITQGFTYFSLTLPTAPSIFDAKRADLLDSRGQGHNLLTAGLFLKKRMTSQEVLLNTAFTYRAGKKFKESAYTPQTETKDSLDHKISISHIYNFSSSLSSFLSAERSFIHEQAISIYAESGQSLILNQFTIGLNYSFETFDLSINYIDDFILGQNKGTVLGKTLGMGFVKRL